MLGFFLLFFGLFSFVGFIICMTAEISKDIFKVDMKVLDIFITASIISAIFVFVGGIVEIFS